MKDCDNWYVNTSTVQDTLPIAYDNYVQYLHEYGEDYTLEALVPAIEKQYVAAIHEFEYVGEREARCLKCSTVYSNDSLVPCFTGEIFMEGDGYPRVLEDGEIVTKSHDYYDVIQAEQGMASFFPWMTISNCLDTCNAEYLTIVRDLVSQHGIQEEQYDSVCIGELLPVEEDTATADGANDSAHSESAPAQPCNAFL